MKASGTATSDLPTMVVPGKLCVFLEMMYSESKWYQSQHFDRFKYRTTRHTVLEVRKMNRRVHFTGI